MIGGQPTTDAEAIRQLFDRVRKLEERRNTIPRYATPDEVQGLQNQIDGIDPARPAAWYSAVLGANTALAVAGTALVTITPNRAGVWWVQGTIDAQQTANLYTIARLIVGGTDATITTAPGVASPTTNNRANVIAFGVLRAPNDSWSVTLRGEAQTAAATTAYAANTQLYAFRIGDVG
jgi:hypothetical protein